MFVNIIIVKYIKSRNNTYSLSLKNYRNETVKVSTCQALTDVTNTKLARQNLSIYTYKTTCLSFVTRITKYKIGKLFLSC